MKKNKILIIKQTSLGDVLHSTSIIKPILEKFPDSEIHFMIDKSAISIIKDNPSIKKIIEFDFGFVERNFKKNFFKVIKYFISILKIIRKEYYQYAFDLQGLGRTAFFLYFARAKYKFIKGNYPFLKGFRKKQLHAIDEIGNVINLSDIKLDKYIYNNFFYYSLKDNVIELKNKINPESFEIIDKIYRVFNITPYIFINEFNKNNLINSHNLLKDLNFKYNKTYFILISPFTKWETKNIPEVKIKEIIISLINKVKTYKYFKNKNIIISISGTKSDFKKVESIIKSIKEVVLKKDDLNISLYNFCSKFTLREFILIMNYVNLVITADSFPMHLASSLNRNLIAVFGPTDEKRVGPINKNALVIRARNIKCARCYRRICKFNKKKSDYKKCMNYINFEEVISYYFKSKFY